jgi:hypothetical protein
MPLILVVTLRVSSSRAFPKEFFSFSGLRFPGLRFPGLLEHGLTEGLGDVDLSSIKLKICPIDVKATAGGDVDLSSAKPRTGIGSVGYCSLSLPCIMD